MKSPREAYKVFAWTAFPLGGKTGRLYHPFITFHIIFMEPQSQHQRRRPRIVAAIQTERQNPAPETQGIGFAAGPGDLAGAHSPGAGGRRRRPGCGRRPREDGGRERRAPHPLSSHTSGPGGGREGAERGGGAVHPGRWPAGRPLGERGGGCSPWPDGQHRRPHALRNGQKTVQSLGLVHAGSKRALGLSSAA